FRAFFAQKTLKRSDGLPVNGVYGFVRMMLNILMDLNTSHIAVAFDSGKKTFRHEKYPEYKSNRPPIPEDMKPQFPIIREVMEVLHIKSIEKEGYEADDIIATLTKQAVEQNFDVLVVSSDKDLMQLVRDNVSMFDAVNKKILGREEVFEKWGVYPERLLDIFSLIGDASDNVPGVPSIGEKTAVQLINEFGNLENVIKNIGDIKQKSRKEAIENNLDKLYLSRELITLCENVELGLTLDDLKYKNLDVQKFKNFLMKMEFFSIAKQVEKYFVFDEETTNRSSFVCKKICDLQTLGTVVENIVNTNKNFYFNIFTKNTNSDDVLAVAFIDEIRKNIYFLRVDEDKQREDLFVEKSESSLELDKVLEKMNGIFENDSIKKIGYNLKENLKILLEYGINIKNFDDLGVMSYILDNGKFSQDFSSLLREYLEANTLIVVQNISKNIDFIQQYEKGKILTDMDNFNLFDFSCNCLEYYIHLYDILNYRLKNEKDLLRLYDEIDKPVVKVLAKMEKDGIKIALKELNNLSLFFNEKLSEIQKRIFDLAGVEFNIASPKQLSNILFNTLHIPPYEKPSKTGQYSTSVEILEKMYEDGYEISERILEYRHYQKLKNTYSDVLPTLIDKHERLHTTFLNTVVITGRLSSINPNLQNIPIKTLDGERIRKAFIARNGYSFIDADYSQIELRILAQYANVKNLLKAFKNDVDIHTKPAMEVFSLDKITPEARQMAKAINFSIIYGTSAFGLAKRLKIPNTKAKEYIDNYFRLYPEIPKYMEEVREFVRRNGFVKTMFGRRCYLDLNSKHVDKLYIDRIAINAPIQGTGADIIKKAMILLDKELEKYGDDVNLLLQIHDELLLEVKDDLVDAVAETVKRVMENVVRFDIPLTVNCKIAKNWGDAH
ncbi:MAG: DNA polymerase I, partial [Rickettsiales bacterium]|nr:DNA polymerase I [Rickettsiales bacterium]